MAEPSTEVHVEVDGRTLRLSNLGKVLYPASGTTKGEVLHYYAQVWPVLSPVLADRAVTRIRWPHGTAGESFFEKNLPAGAAPWLRRAEVPTTGSRAASARSGTLTFPVVDSLAALTYLVNLASLELHVHQWRVSDDGEPLPPDRLVIDLDPGEPAGLPECARVALLVRERLEGIGLATVPVTSGGKGLHLYAELDGSVDAHTSSELAKAVAEGLQADHGALVTAVMTKAKRGGKVFLDWSQNSGSKTTIAPWSLRGGARPTVALPRRWSEVEAEAEDPGQLFQATMAEALDEAARRVAAGRTGLFSGG